MILPDDIKNSLSILNKSNIISDQVYRNLLDIVIQDILQSQTTDLKSICGTKPDVIKEIHAVLLKTFLIFAQNNVSKEKANSVLTKDCKIDNTRSKLFTEKYEKHKMQLEFKLGNLGTHLPHIVDVEWELDLLVKSSASDSSHGPLFKITLITECFDKVDQAKKTENVGFWCTSQELEHLVYKFEDAVRHCQKIGGVH